MASSTSSNPRAQLGFLPPLVAVAAALLFGSFPLRTGAQANTPAATGHGFVGAWRLTFETPIGTSEILRTVMADDTLLFSGQPVKPAAGIPVTFISAGHGTWQPTPPNTAAATWVAPVADGEGNVLAIATDSVEATLGVDGNSWSGRYSASVADPNGTVLYVGGATVRATRITLQPLATPAAGTPTLDQG